MADTQTSGVSLFTPEMLANPYPVYAHLRANHPVCRVEALDAWFVTSYAAISAALRNPALSSDRFMRAKKRLGERGLAGLADERFKSLIHMDPPDHTRLRSLVNKAFTPHVVDGMEARIQLVIDELLDGVAPAGKMDVIKDLAYPLPVIVIAEMLGIPAADRDRLKQWSDDISPVLSGDVGGLSEETLLRVVAARKELGEYFRTIVGQRRRSPGDDLLTALIEAEEGAGRLSEDELYSTLVLLLFAGHETTTNLIGNGLLALLQHSSEKARVWEEAAPIPPTVEEMLRYDSPVQLTNRLATRDITIEGVTIRAGEWVYLVLAAGNRDPGRFAEPDRFDATRSDNKHLAFGGGPHFCIGAPLARLEGRLVLSTLRRRFPEISLGSAKPQYRNNFNLRGLAALPVIFSTTEGSN